ncbi:MAG: RcnB family protein [Comamonas sp.]|uniref:RcnB family protein n=1 Tax=Comamonas sp. TaxID=34028 RepID=UPI003025F767
MSRLTHRILCASMAACLGLGSLAAYAQPGPPREGRGSERADDRGRYDNQHQDRNRYDNRYDNRHDGRHMGRDEHRGAGPDHRWTRGTRVPPQYRGHNYVVNDWRAHRLPAPPRGHHWIQNGSDYLLVAIATGVIASMVLNSSY